MFLGLVTEGAVALGLTCIVADSVIYACGYAVYWLLLQLIEGFAQFPEEHFEDVESPEEQPDAQATESLEQNPWFEFEKPSEEAAPRALSFDKWLRGTFWYVAPESTPSFLKSIS